MAILINKKVPFIEKASMTNREGRYLFIKGTVAEHLYTFATLYAPNGKHYRYLKRTLHKLHSFAERVLIIEGDLNIAMDPIWDCST
ncbi:Hypothetical predicted protein, partial [Pelobates cultripes]